MPEPNTIYQGGLHIKEQHEIVVDLFRLDGGEMEAFTEGTINQFRNRMVFLISFLLAFKFLFGIVLPSFLDIGLIFVFNFLIVSGLVKFFISFNEKIVKRVWYIPVYILLSFGSILLLSLTYVS